MSLVSTFVDAFKKAAGKQPEKPEIDMKTHGPLGSSYSPEAFTPLRPTPEPDTGKGIGHRRRVRGRGAGRCHIG